MKPTSHSLALASLLLICSACDENPKATDVPGTAAAVPAAKAPVKSVKAGMGLKCLKTIAGMENTHYIAPFTRNGAPVIATRSEKRMNDKIIMTSFTFDDGKNTHLFIVSTGSKIAGKGQRLPSAYDPKDPATALDTAKMINGECTEWKVDTSKFHVPSKK